MLNRPKTAILQINKAELHGILGPAAALLPCTCSNVVDIAVELVGIRNDDTELPEKVAKPPCELIAAAIPFAVMLVEVFVEFLGSGN
jgi:hypothetical protein